MSKSAVQHDRGKYSSLAKGERGQIVNLSAPIGEVARSAVGEVSRRGKKAAFTPHRSGYSATNFGKTPRLLRSAGFTLAETLITIGIIGVVSALTIPNLIQEHQKRATVTKLQKGISIINQAYKLSFEEQGEPESAFDIGSEAYFKQYWQPYIKMLQYCDTYQKCGYKNRELYAMNKKDHINVVSTFEGRRTTFYTLDGFVFVILVAKTSNNKTVPSNDIFIDINGGQEPNIFGKDVFRLERIADGGGVRPYGYEKSNEEINEDCSKTGGGYYCAEKIRRAGWRIEKDYPW